MRLVWVTFCLICFSGVYGQSDQLAQSYFDQGEFKKALHLYEKLVKEDPNNPQHFAGLIATYQQLEDFEAAEELIQEKINTSANAPHYLVELGHNYQLQERNRDAEHFFGEALRVIESRPSYAFSIARTFEKYSLLEKAIEAYELGMKANPDAEYHLQMARLYGEKGELEKMFESYLQVLSQNPSMLPVLNRTYGDFITDDPQNEANKILRNLLLRKLQSEQNLLYNQMLSWLFVQQKDFKRAFLQEKAIFHRASSGMGALMQLTMLSEEGGEPETAVQILEFIIEETTSEEIKLQAHQLRLGIRQQILSPREYEDLAQEYRSLLDTYGRNINTLSLQIDYANFLGFHQKKTPEAIAVLKPLVQDDFPAFEEAAVKMALADLLVLDEKFNQALIYYTQVQHLVENDVLAQNARFKVARTSYFKGDFQWAQIQLDVLKSAASQLIANDAFELSLLIKENSIEDTTQQALKKFARADLLAFQKKHQSAIELLDTVVSEHKGEHIEDDALLKQALLFEETGQYEQAEENYLHLISLFESGILSDNAHYQLAELYAGVLQDPKKALKYYEKIIFDYSDSIYFVEARKKFRTLRKELEEGI